MEIFAPAVQTKFIKGCRFLCGLCYIMCYTW